VDYSLLTYSDKSGTFDFGNLFMPLRNPKPKSKSPHPAHKGSSNSDVKLLSLFGDNLKRERSRAKLTQEQLAELSDIDRSHISDIERGLNAPTIIVAHKLATGLGIRLSDLLVRVEDDLLA
jgi:DNA-binding XRE family transcriptional regulator